jgi:colanic acid/amylovoran biosynthesis glycosyltransferase
MIQSGCFQGQGRSSDRREPVPTVVFHPFFRDYDHRSHFFAVMSRPTVSIFCPTFLKPEMWHLYRQVVGPSKVRIAVHAFKRENADRFPYSDLFLLPRSRFRWARRIWYTQIRRSPQLALPTECRGLSLAIHSQRSALLHIYFGNNGIFWLPFIRKSPVPVIVSFHGADVHVGLNSRSADQRLHEVFRLADAVLTRSESLAETIRQKGCPPEKLFVHRTGIPLEQYPLKPRATPVNNAWQLVQACRLIEKKGLGVTLRAFAKFQKTYPAAKLFIAGDGPLRSQLGLQAERLGIAGSVVFTGFLNAAELARIFHSAHIFVHPSETAADGNQEGVPNSLLEAMATGLPCVSTRHGGIPEAITDGVSGFLVNEGDSEALFLALEKLVRNDELRQLISQRAAETVAIKFNTVEQIKKLEEIYLACIAHPPRGG